MVPDIVTGSQPQPTFAHFSRDLAAFQTAAVEPQPQAAQAAPPQSLSIDLGQAQAAMNFSTPAGQALAADEDAEFAAPPPGEADLSRAWAPPTVVAQAPHDRLQAGDAQRAADADSDQAPSHATRSREAAGDVQSAIRKLVEAGQKQIVVRLNPPELGRVHIVLRSDGQEVSARLTVENRETYVQMHREVGQLVSRLAEGGVELKRLDINFSDSRHSAASAFSDAAGSGHWRGQEQPAQAGRDPRQAAGHDAADDRRQAAGEGAMRSYVEGGRLNVWI